LGSPIAVDAAEASETSIAIATVVVGETAVVKT